MCQIESHPFQPFLPGNAGILFLGSFPPQEKRWCMPFYYPNWTNDFWRVMGLLFHQDRDWFAVPGEKRFDREKVQAFCREQGLALFRAGEDPSGDALQIRAASVKRNDDRVGRDRSVTADVMKFHRLVQIELTGAQQESIVFITSPNGSIPENGCARRVS